MSQVLLDPATGEEEQKSGELSLVYNEDGALLSLIQPGGSAISDAVIKDCMNKARTQVPEILKVINYSLGVVSNK